MKINSIWETDAPSSNFPALEGDISVDVAIVGAGITGITTAQQLIQMGRKVVVLEAGTVGGSTTGYSTGNLYAPIGDRLYTIASSHDKESLRMVVEARVAAIDLVAELVQKLDLQCNFNRVPFMLYSQTGEGEDVIEKERKAARDAGLHPSDQRPQGLPFPIKAMLRLDGQAQFNPMSYTRTLAAKIQGKECRIFEHSRVIKVERGEPCKLHTDRGIVTAAHVVLATHTPIGIYGVHTAMGPYREYAIACRMNDAEKVPEGIYWEMGSMNTHNSMRPYNSRNGNYMLALGGTHKVGHKEHNEDEFSQLRSYLSDRFTVQEITHTWAAQQYKAADHLPYIGPDGAHSNIYIATGFAADGLTYGTVAGMIIADQITRKNNMWAKYFNANRITPVASAKDFIKENVDVAVQFVKDRVMRGSVKEMEEMRPGEGRTMMVEGDHCAVYRESVDTYHVVSAVCTHIGCIVHFNSAEKSWDCPCHGSRFDVEGRVLEGPAIKPLSVKKVDRS